MGGGRRKRGGGSKVSRHLRHIATQDRREVGIDHGGVAARDELDQRGNLVTGRHLRKAQVARECRHLALMRGMAIGVHEHDRDRLEAVGLGLHQRGAHGGEIGRSLHGAVGAHALGDFDDALVEDFRLDDMAGENLRAGLVADLERVTKPLGDEQ
jgi:hypothetical protein